MRGPKITDSNNFSKRQQQRQKASMWSANDTSVRLTGGLLGVLLLLCSTSTHAFTSPSSATSVSRCRTTDGFVLGPVARNGLGYEDGVLGDGRRILPGDTVYCYYVGSFAAAAKQAAGPFGGFLGGGGGNGGITVFDSVTEGEPFKFEVGKGQVIKGMDLGILGFDDEIPPMNVGGKRLLTIPSPLAYGDVAQGPIPANQDLTFELEVLDAGNENPVGLSTRLVGYAAAAGIPLIILLVAFNFAAGNF